VTQGPGRQNLYAAAIVGGALILSGVLVARQLSGINRKLDDVRKDIAEAQTAIARLQQAPPRVVQNQPQRPDPNQRYTLNTAGAPMRGAQTAPVKIVEFSDFQ